MAGQVFLTPRRSDPAAVVPFPSLTPSHTSEREMKLDFQEVPEWGGSHLSLPPLPYPQPLPLGDVFLERVPLLKTATNQPNSAGSQG